MLPKYKRILLKLSGESLMGDKNFGLDSTVIAQYAKERKEFCANFLQPTTTTNHKTVDNPTYEARRSRLSELSLDSKNPAVVRQVVARASMITELVG